MSTTAGFLKTARRRKGELRVQHGTTGSRRVRIDGVARRLRARPKGVCARLLPAVLAALAIGLALTLGASVGKAMPPTVSSATTVSPSAQPPANWTDTKIPMPVEE